MTEAEARTKLVEHAKSLNIYYVIWNGHFGNSIVACKRCSENSLASDIYSAIYEEFYDLIKSDSYALVCNITIDNNINSYVDMWNYINRNNNV